jgi:hypothetical protein
MPLLPQDQILALTQRAVADGLAGKRDMLFSGLDANFVSMLEENGVPRDQLLLDLTAMNGIPKIDGDVTPLHHWLMMAKFLVGPRPDSQRFYEALADKVAAAAGGANPAPGDGPAQIDLALMPEKVIFKNDLVPTAFIAGATRTAVSVARMIVPQVVGGQPRLSASSGEPVRFFGTGWLIGAGFLITNRHVVEARAPGEAAADEADVAEQSRRATAEFDYDSEGMAPVTAAIAGLAAADATLDYAVLRLAAPSGRAGLPLSRDPPVIDANDPFPVNVIQHPGGAPKHFGIRNNLVANLSGNDLAYYTDTAGGSSGSPVCDDRWRVVALHKASTQKFGLQNFQGKQTAWVNVGTPIGLIVDDLRANHAALWAEIGATLA